jgi:fructan beta-fructosidase
MKIAIALLLTCWTLSAAAQWTEVPMKITHRYLNVPVGYTSRMKMVELRVGGQMKREFPVQLAADTIGYWIYIDVSEFKGQRITIACPAGKDMIGRIYQADEINGSDSLYKESNRPQFHFTVKRGWSNDINGPIWYNGQYHLFWQAFPFGLSWNTGFMYWGHAVSKDLLHWEELPAALMLDSLGSPWSGTAVIDHNNDGGWGKDALVLYYACYDRVSFMQVQCVAYSNDGGKTFTHYAKNPVLNTDWELHTTDTRDPKVFWYGPGKVWVMVLFEKDGMSFFNSTDMRHWERKSHFKGLWECPDFFELPVEGGRPVEGGKPVVGDTTVKKWVLHGGSSDYFIGSFDGQTFTPETGRLHYAEGKNARGEDCLYATQSFENMPDGRRVQMAWGRIAQPGMPFTQMMLFPTEFSLHRTAEGLRMYAAPIREIDQLHAGTQEWQGPTVSQANENLAAVKPGPMEVKMKFTLAAGKALRLRYQGNEILDLAPADVDAGVNELEILIDKTVVEVFLNEGERYIIHQLMPAVNGKGLEFDSQEYGPDLQSVQVYPLQSVWAK